MKTKKQKPVQHKLAVHPMEYLYLKSLGIGSWQMLKIKRENGEISILSVFIKH